MLRRGVGRAPVFLLLLALFVPACHRHRKAPRGGSGTTPVVTVLDERFPGDAGAIVIINGTYGPACDGRSGDWSYRVDEASTIPLPHPPLSIDPGDGDCELMVISVITADGQTHVVRLDDAGVVPGGPVVNVDVDVAQGGDVNVVVVVTDPGDAGVAPGTTSEGFPASSQGIVVPAPDYLFDVTDLRLQTNADDVVIAVQGGMALQARTTRARGYAVVDGAARSYGELQAAYVRRSFPFSEWIDATEMELLGADLTVPAARTVVLANVLNGVASYQAIVVTFAPASRQAR